MPSCNQLWFLWVSILFSSAALPRIFWLIVENCFCIYFSANHKSFFSSLSGPHAILLVWLYQYLGLYKCVGALCSFSVTHQHSLKNQKEQISTFLLPPKLHIIFSCLSQSSHVVGVGRQNQKDKICHYIINVIIMPKIWEGFVHFFPFLS